MRKTANVYIPNDIRRFAGLIAAVGGPTNPPLC